MATNPIKSSCKWWKLCEFRLIHLPKCKASWSYKLKVSKKAKWGKTFENVISKMDTLLCFGIGDYFRVKC